LQSVMQLAVANATNLERATRAGDRQPNAISKTVRYLSAPLMQDELGTIARR